MYFSFDLVVMFLEERKNVEPVIYLLIFPDWVFIGFDLVYLFNGIKTFVGYLISKPSL